MSTRKKTTARQSAWRAVQRAKKALREGRKGASQQLDKAIKRHAEVSCRIKATPGTKKRTAYATISKIKKAGTTAKKATTRKRKTTSR